MTDTRLAIVVLAAGQGTRMRSALPKVLHPLAGRPVIGHVLAVAAELDAAEVLVVVRHERDRVAAAVRAQHPQAVIVDQDETPGTGRAVELAVAALPAGFAGELLVLSGDVPLLDAPTLRTLIAAHRDAAAAATLLSALLDEPAGYGRILRDEAGALVGIVEQKDASAEQRAIDEVNAGVYVFDARLLAAVLPGLGSDNSQGEKYLTDAIGALHGAGNSLSATTVAEPWRIEGINDRAQLAAASARLNAQLVRRWQLAGVTIEDPLSTWIDVNVTLEPEVVILPNTQLKGATLVQSGAIVGPDTTLLDSEVGEGAVVRRVDAVLAVVGSHASVGPFVQLRAGSTVAAGETVGAFAQRAAARLRTGEEAPPAAGAPRPTGATREAD